ncbi:class I SAM-dependent methyltransferase [Nisaea sp.]|uniref:class I SAM-dependent methyltransferase n=1 Tax=Nisaea sp. TaxID=2024842 RepID=UPI00326352C7
MANIARFWDRHAAGYAKRAVSDPEAYQHKLELTQRLLKPDMRVLEFGCGTGTTALHHAPYVKSIRAIDVSAKMLEIARAKAEEAGIANVSFEQSDIEGLSAEDGSYDLVMGHSILHLLEDRHAVIAKVWRLLKADGLFVTSTACIGGTMPWLKLILPVGNALGLLPKVAFIRPDELVGEFETAGFRIEQSWQPGPSKGLFIIARKA